MKNRISLRQDNIPPINGQPAPVMDRKTEKKLRSMFKEIQAPFLKHWPGRTQELNALLVRFAQVLQAARVGSFLEMLQAAAVIAGEAAPAGRDLGEDLSGVAVGVY